MKYTGTVWAQRVASDYALNITVEAENEEEARKAIIEKAVSDNSLWDFDHETPREEDVKEVIDLKAEKTYKVFVSAKKVYYEGTYLNITAANPKEAGKQAIKIVKQDISNGNYYLEFLDEKAPTAFSAEVEEVE